MMNAPDVKFYSNLSLYSLNDGGIGHAAAFAHGLQAIAAATALQFVDKGGHQPRTARAQWMSQRDGAAIHVDTRKIRPGLRLPGQHHAGKRLIDFNAVYVAE